MMSKKQIIRFGTGICLFALYVRNEYEQVANRLKHFRTVCQRNACRGANRERNVNLRQRMWPYPPMAFVEHEKRFMWNNNYLPVTIFGQAGRGRMFP
jgi:DNA polymerase IIIc chi subunit